MPDPLSNRVIHKYVLDLGQTTIQTYERARFLHVHQQHGQATLWAEVNTLGRECTRTIVVVPTGGAVPPDGAYLGTAIGVANVLVVHVYLVEHADA